MAPGRVAKLWLVALLLTVVLSVAAAAVTTTTTKATTTTTTTKAPSTTANAAKDSPVVEDDPDPVPQDVGLAVDDTAPSAPVDDMDPAVDDPDMEEDDPPTGGSAATGGSAGGSVGGAAVGDDVEASAGDDAADDGDEGKAGTGKRSVADTWDSFKDKMKDAKEKAKEMYEKSKDAIKNAFANWPQKIKDKFNGLSETIKTKIFGGKASNLTAEEIGSLNKNQLRMLVPMSGVAGMNETLQQKVFDRFMALNDGQSMRRVLESMDVKTRADLIERIEDVNSKLGGDEMGKQRLVMSMTDKLGDPRNWTAAEVDMMKSKNILKFIPPARLTRINDTAILSKIDIPRKASMKSKKMADQKAWADFILHKKMSAKAVGEWTSADINAREGDFSVKDLLGNIPLKTLNMIKNDALYDSFGSQPAAESLIEPPQGRLMAEKLMAEFKKRTPTADPNTVKSFATSRLGMLSEFVDPDELISLVDPSKQNNANDIKTMLEGAFGNKNARPEKRCDVFKRSEKGANLTAKSSAEISSISSKGMLNCVPLKYLNMWVNEGKLQPTSLNADILSPGQIRALARTASGLAAYQKSGGGGLDPTKIPAPLLSAASVAELKDADWNSVKNKINQGGKLDKAQRAMFVSKATASQVVDGNLGPAYTELVPVADLKGLTAAKKKTAAMAAGPDSPLRMLSADDPERPLPDAVTAANAGDLYQPGLPFVDADQVAMSISTDEIQAVLEKLREKEDEDEDMRGFGGLSPKLCVAMKKALANATQLMCKDEDDDASILCTMTKTDLSSLPPCVVGRLSRDEVSAASPDQKMGILDALGHVKPAQLKMLNRRNCQALVQQAINAMKPTGDLTAEHAGLINMAAACLPASEIKRLDRLAFDALKMNFKYGCLDKSQADAIADQLIKYYGQPDTWMSLEPLCDLLPLLDDSQLREIDEKRLAATCGDAMSEMSQDGSERFGKTAEMLCMRQTSSADHTTLKERMMNVGMRVARGKMMIQKALTDELNSTPAAVRRRRRREADPALTCALVEETGQGAAPWTVSQLNQLTAADVKMCQKALGSMMTDSDKLSAVWSKLKEAYENDAGKVPMKDIGYVLSVISTSDIMKLNLATFDAVSAVGRPNKVSTEQLKELWKRAKAQFSGFSGESSGYVSDNLIAAGQIICGMEADSVASIPDAQIKPVMKTLSEVQWCPDAVKEKLAAKSLALNGGNPETLGKAEIAEMGALIGGLDAMQLKKIASSSMAGLTASGMMSIPASKIAVLTAEQVSQLSPAAALSVTSEQRDMLPEDSRKALDKVLEDSVTAKSGAAQAAGVLLSTLLFAFVATRMA